MMDFRSLLQRYHKETHRLRTTFNVDHSRYTNNCFCFAQLSPHEMNQTHMQWIT